MEIGNYAEALVPIYQAAERHVPWKRQITDSCVFFILPNSICRKTNIFVDIDFSPINIQQATLDEGGDVLVLQSVQLKSGPYFNISNLFTTCYITQLTWIYSKCWKW
jgi:hypothetical protein